MAYVLLNRGRVNLIVQPDDGLSPILDAITRAKESLDVLVFRLDVKRIERALEAAVHRGVAVRVLVAHTNSDGEKRLRQFEQRMLAAGITVSRTGDDLVRFHAKFLVIDRTKLHLYGFNCTGLDLKSRSFGLVCEDRRVVEEALRLFEADVLRQEFEPSVDALVVSPENAREQLATFIKRAKRQLVIYDPKLTDPQMIRLLSQRVKAGVDVRIIGKAAKRAPHLSAQKCPGKRLHVRAMVRDGNTAFVGSQSLRALELDGRREVGLVTKDVDVVNRLLETFEADWARTARGAEIQAQVTEEFELAPS